MSTYADLIVGLQQSAKAFRENTVYDSDGDPLRLIVQADENDAAADAISRLEREKAEAITLLSELCSDARMGITHTTGIWERVEAFLSRTQEQTA